ncbi:MAG: orotidine-5'-phosphate decarboxylase [Oscillospiraceae bacterium]|jgi:orotidine-5'-phosphate decarboxylase|nr:orotidine-5'-phosphate decarboxylase [Oscillospiraceae bacterium]
MSADALAGLIAQTRNPSVIGLDPRPEYMPPGLITAPTLAAAASAFLKFNKAIIDATHDIVPAVKLQCACYEALGPPGARALRGSILHARAKGMYVIADGKRGDIGSSAELYSKAFLGKTEILGERLEAYPAHALTVNPYLGSDNLDEFLKDCAEYGKMAFVLVKTSNKSSSEVQELPAGDRPLYRVIADQVDRAGARLVGKCGYSSAGIVAGATQPRFIKELRSLHPRLFFLVPGYGAQGGAAKGAAEAFDRKGGGAIVASSREIICAWQKLGTGDFAQAAREAALRMRNELRMAVCI